GFLGALLAAVRLARTDKPVGALVRAGHDIDSLAARIHPELVAEGRPLADDELRRRLVLAPLDAGGLGEAGRRALSGLAIGDVVHCAGCLDYFNDAELEAVNVAFTGRMVALAREVNARRVVFVSTAFSSGYRDDPVHEALLDDPVRDPTAYTRTKRAAERLVAAGGLPYLIVRPSVVIGDSRTGRYSGKRYGLYQLWSGLERLLYDRHHPELHAVAPRQPFNFIHQDSFQNAMAHLLERPDASGVVNLVSDGPAIPTVRDVWELWLDALGRPERVHYYDHIRDVRLADIHPRQKAFMMFASVNIEIAGHLWAFETTALARMRVEGLVFTDATLPTIARCQDAFIDASPRLLQYRSEHRMVAV
ncbi:SDR family oxidoreductase, partial [Azospirillum sp.]|uniref:SDR family oxidoreductase n=1 Tax=Azospirillum sp. TaxID=34012 RepID=UPI003D73DDBE